MASRCHETSGTPFRGEIRKRSAKVVADCGLSATTSSKRKITSFGLTPTLPESGMIATILGAATSGAPPGGMRGEAHADANNTAAISRRKALSLLRQAARVALSIPLLLFARLRPPRPVRG